MTKDAMIKFLKSMKDLIKTFPDEDIKDFIRSYFTTGLTVNQLSDRETMKLIKALQTIDTIPVEELRDFAYEIFDESIAEVEAKDDDAGV